MGAADRQARSRGRGLLHALAAATLGSAALLGSPAAALAQPIKTNSFTLDVFQGPVLAPADIIGTAGAYAGYAEGLDGLVSNAAAPAVRSGQSVTFLDWDVSGSISVPIRLFGGNDDFDDSGKNDHDFSSFIYGTAGAMIQYGVFGAGVNVELQRYSLTSKSAAGSSTTTDVFLGRYHALLGFRLLGDQLMLGGGARMATLSLDPRASGTRDLTMIGAAPEVGFLVRPDWHSFRIGGTFRFPVHGGQFIGAPESEKGLKTAGGLVLPGDVVVPWELELGATLQVGPRPLNPEWIDPRKQEEALHAAFEAIRNARWTAQAAELAVIADPRARAARAKALADAEPETRREEDREEERVKKRLVEERRGRTRDWPREHLTLFAELLVTGDVSRGLGMQDFLSQTLTTGRAPIGSSGAKVNFSPRVGVETEPIPGWMHTRVGSYYEPARISPDEKNPRVGRQHFTFGADVRLFSTTWFGLSPRTEYKAQAYADLSPRYQSVSVGLGVWH